MSRLAVNSGTNRLGSTENLLDGTLKRLGKRLGSHLTGNVNDLVQRNRTVVLDVLLLLSVSWGLLKSTNDQRRGRGNNRDSSLTVLDGKLNSDTDTLVVLGGLGDIFTDLLGGETERTDLGSKSGRSTNFTTSGSQVDDLNFRGVKLKKKRKKAMLILCTFSNSNHVLNTAMIDKNVSNWKLHHAIAK